MKTIPILLSALVLSATNTYAEVGPTTLTFDDMSPVEYVLIPNGYHGFQWNNFFIQNGSRFDSYLKGAVSPPNVAFNWFGQPASFSSGIAFTLQSAYLTSVFAETQQIGVQGFLGGIKTYDNTYTVNNAGPILLNFNYSGVDEVRFFSSSSHFALDNMVVVVPEPSGWSLFAIAVAAVAFGRQKTNSRGRSQLDCASA